MDIVSHAVAGACSGAIFGRPLAGAAWAVVPDLVLGIKRLKYPTELYRATHSLFFIAAIAVFLYWSTPNYRHAALLAILSHHVLDAPTHGVRWAPMPLYPFSSYSISIGNEWEWFNESWWHGLLLTVIWSVVCLSLV